MANHSAFLTRAPQGTWNVTQRRQNISHQNGFTLIELLVVILVIGVLAAIAIPSFLNQREKAQDACAKSLLMSARTAMETYLTDNNNYLGVNLTELHTIEQVIPTGGSCNSNFLITIGDAGAGDCAGVPAAPSYCVGVRSAAGGVAGRPFVLNRFATGEIQRNCGANAGGANGGGCPNGVW